MKVNFSQFFKWIIKKMFMHHKLKKVQFSININYEQQ